MNKALRMYCVGMRNSLAMMAADHNIDTLPLLANNVFTAGLDMLDPDGPLVVADKACAEIVVMGLRSMVLKSEANWMTAAKASMGAFELQAEQLLGEPLVTMENEFAAGSSYTGAGDLIIGERGSPKLNEFTVTPDNYASHDEELMIKGRITGTYYPIVGKRYNGTTRINDALGPISTSVVDKIKDLSWCVDQANTRWVWIKTAYSAYAVKVVGAAHVEEPTPGVDEFYCSECCTTTKHNAEKECYACIENELLPSVYDEPDGCAACPDYECYNRSDGFCPYSDDDL